MLMSDFSTTPPSLRKLIYFIRFTSRVWRIYVNSLQIARQNRQPRTCSVFEIRGRLLKSFPEILEVLPIPEYLLVLCSHSSSVDMYFLKLVEISRNCRPSDLLLDKLETINCEQCFPFVLCLLWFVICDRVFDFFSYFQFTFYRFSIFFTVKLYWLSLFCVLVLCRFQLVLVFCYKFPKKTKVLLELNLFSPLLPLK